MSTDIAKENEEAAADEERIRGHAPIPKLRITSISFATLVNLGNFQNARFGAEAEVPEGEDPAEAMGELTDWVNRQAGKPTRAEKAASKTLAALGTLYAELNHYISVARYSHDDIRRLSEDLASTPPKPVDHLEAALRRARDRLERAKSEIELKTKEIQAAEMQPKILAARALLQDVVPKMPTIEAPGECDDIPC